MASDVWQALGLARQTGIEYWPGEGVYAGDGHARRIHAAYQRQPGRSGRDCWRAGGRATAYDVQLVSGEILTAVGPADLERDAKRAAIDYLKHEHTPERTRPARRSAE